MSGKTGGRKWTMEKRVLSFLKRGHLGDAVSYFTETLGRRCQCFLLSSAKRGPTVSAPNPPSASLGSEPKSVPLREDSACVACLSPKWRPHASQERRRRRQTGGVHFPFSCTVQNPPHGPVERNAHACRPGRWAAHVWVRT